MKKSVKKYRNPAAVSANSRNSGGPMRSKRNKRKKSKKFLIDKELLDN